MVWRDLSRYGCTCEVGGEFENLEFFSAIASKRFFCVLPTSRAHPYSSSILFFYFLKAYPFIHLVQCDRIFDERRVANTFLHRIELASN